MKIKKQNTPYIATKGSNTNFLLLIPIIVTIALIPLIVLAKEIPTHLDQFSWYSYESKTLDCFLYYKQVFLLITGSIMLFLLILFFYKKRQEFRFKPIFCFLAIYAFMAVLSTLFSDHIVNTLTGIPDQLESIFILLVYCILCFYSYQFVRSEQDIKRILSPLMISIAFLCLLGITQMIGHDFLSSSFGSKIITASVANQYTISLNFGKTVFLTLFNPNYVGIYCVLILPLLLMLLFHSSNWKQRFLYIAFIVGLMGCLIGSGSQTGIITMCISILFLILLNRHLLYQYIKISIPLLIVVLLAGIGLTFKVNIPQRIVNFTHSDVTTHLNQVETKADCVTITYDNEPLNITFETDQVSTFNFNFTDSKGEPVNYVSSQDYSSLTIEDPRYPQYVVQPALFNNIYSFRLTIEGTDWFFTNLSEDGSYYYMNCYGKMLKVNNASPSALPESSNSFASGRGYIWSKSIPLLKEHLLLGSGADTFIFEFPNDDYVGMITNGFNKQIMTKPHSMYLQIGIQTGMISLIAFILFYLCYFIKSLKLYLKGPLNTYTKQIGAAILVSTFGYMFSGLVNDSPITVAPIYWVFLGIGLAMNEYNSLNGKLKMD